MDRTLVVVVRDLCWLLGVCAGGVLERVGRTKFSKFGHHVREKT